MATHSSTLAWKIPRTEEPGRLQSMGSLRVGHDWVTSFSCIGVGNGNPLQCSCLENPRDGGAWWAAVCGVTQSQTWLKWVSSSSSMLNPMLGSTLEAQLWAELCPSPMMLKFQAPVPVWPYLKNKILAYDQARVRLLGHGPLGAQPCLILWDPMDWSQPGSSVHVKFSRQEYWSGLPFPPPGDLSNPGIKPACPALAGRFFITKPPGKPPRLLE